MADLFTTEPQGPLTTIPNLLQYQQGNDVAAAPEGFEQITNPLNPLLRAGSRLNHFTDGVYDTSAESHLMRLLKVLLGESGVGGVQRSMLLVRLQQAMQGTHFFDLDAFYGAIFGARRRSGEIIDSDPYIEVLPMTKWDDIRLRDGSYRARVSRLSSAIHLGATPGGIEALAEALTGIEFDIIEGWQYGSYNQYTHDDWEAFTWDDMEAFTWDELEFSDEAPGERARNVITLYPHQTLLEGERFDLERALDRIKPAHMIVLVSDEPVDLEITDVPYRPSSPSEKWEIRQLVQNTRINGILPYPDYEEGEFIEPPQSAFGGYSGEAWSALDKAPRSLAYYKLGEISNVTQVDPDAVDMPPQALLSQTGTTQATSLPEFALKPIQGLYAGRSVSDGVIVSNPYEYRPGGQTGMYVDKVPSEYVSEQITSAAKIGQRFWTTPARPFDSGFQEILEMRFDEPVSINRITFEYAKFPCRVDLQVWDRGAGAWQHISSTRNLLSNPYGIGNSPPVDAIHPYHYGNEHWERATLSFQPLSGRYFRFVCSRLDGQGPVGTNGTKIPYPLGLRNIDLGYRVDGVSKIPHVPATSPVASTRNILGLQSRYYLSRDVAANVADASPITSWICEPQPIADAVVPLYLSVGSNGIPAVLNQIYVDPVYTGVVTNLYYTSSYPEGNNNALPADDVVSPVGFIGSPIPVAGAAGGLRLATNDAASVLIDGQPLGGDGLGGTWWIGLEWEPLTSNVDGYRMRPILASAMSDIPVFLSHGVTETTEDYAVFLQVNGRLVRCLFTDFLPAPGNLVRAVIQVNPTGDPIMTVRAGGITQVSTAWDPALQEDAPYDELLSYDFAATFDPSRYEFPEGYRMQQARSARIYLNASDYQTGDAAWRNSGTAGSQYSADPDDAVFLSVFESAYRLPGYDQTFLEVEDFAAADIAGDLSLVLRLKLDDWQSLDVNGNEQVLFSRWGTDLDENDACSWKWSIDDDGVLWFTSSVDGTPGDIFLASSDLATMAADTPEVFLGLTHEVDTGSAESVCRFWRSTDGVFWELIHEFWDTLSAHTRDFSADPQSRIRIGTFGKGEDGSMRGIVSYAAVYDGMGVDNTPGGTKVFEMTQADMQSVHDWSGADPVFETTLGGLEVTVKRSSFVPVDAASQCSAKLLIRDTFTESMGMILTNSQDMNPTITDVSQTRSLNVLFDGVLDYGAATDPYPVLVKKFSHNLADPGWGIYQDEDAVVLRVSDGATQEEVSLSILGTEQRGRPVTFQIATAPEGDITFTAKFRDASVLQGSIAAADIPTGSLYNNYPIYAFTDPDGLENVGSVNAIIVDVTPILTTGQPIIDADLWEGFALGDDLSAVGSSWKVTTNGVFAGLELHPGDWLFPIQQEAVGVSGSTNETMPEMGYMAVPAGHIAIGSGATIGTDIKLTQAALGFGAAKSAFLEDPRPFSIIPESNVHSAEGTFLRFHFEYIGWTDGDTPSIGFMGGSPDAWSSAQWTPIGQFTLSKGITQFPDVAAVGLKLEFTGLAPEPYEAFMPVNRVVNRFSQRPVEAQGRSRDNVAQATIDLLTPNRFPDAVRGVFYDQDARINYVSPTTGVSVIDGTQRDAIGKRFGFGYTQAAWQPQYRAHLQSLTGVHEYNVTEVQATSRTAFFVGLRTIEVRRARRNGLSDTKFYDDTLLDSSNLVIEETTFEVEPGQMYTPESTASSLMVNQRVAVSKPFYSRRPVTAVQFATQQTGPAQIIPDDEFRSPGLVSYQFDLEGDWHKSGDAIIFWDANQGAVRVSRDPSVLDAFYAPDTPIVHPPVSPVLSSGFGHLVTLDFDSYGGISSPTVSASPSGVLFAGARVSAYRELQADLWLRVYGSDGETMLAERNFRPKVGVPTEVILPYTLGNIPDLADGLQVRVEQDGPYKDSWFMHALSGFDTSIIWEFSVDDGETWVPGYSALGLRYGVVDFPTPGTALRWRVVAYRHNAVIDAITMRPWYQARLGAAL